jgi:2,4-dienoyl-CoA reductase-like NADH-dependent reductase (Old Yellow Enzyme family)
MPILFETATIKSMSLANRFVRSATWEGMANEDGSCSRRLIDLMVGFAKGGVGLIITSHAYVSREGRAGLGQLGIYSAEMVPGLTAMADAVHDAGGKIAVQLAHAGCHADQGLTGRIPIGPSIVKAEGVSDCREMAGEDFRMVADAFGKAAARAKEAGFDAVQIHSAHGFLLSEFLSPFYNKRKDRYGGSVENRARLLVEVVQNIRNEVGESFPVMVKVNSEDFVTGGLTVDDMLEAASILESAGVDAVELSGGTRYSGDFIPVRLGKIDSEDMGKVYYLEAARRFKKRVGVPLMLVGGIRSHAVAERIIREGIADYISLSRPLIREPDLVNRWKSGDTAKAKCLSDNLCFEPARGGEGLYCVVEKRGGRMPGSDLTPSP